jgi:IPT/TIG domain
VKLAVVVAFAAACGGDAQPRAEIDEPPGVLRTLEDFTTQMCGCTDKTCADRIAADLAQWGAELAAQPPPDEALRERLAGVMPRYTECHTRAMAGITSYAPEVVAVAPAEGDAHGGTYVVLKGLRFLDEPRAARVYFGGREGTVVRFASNTELIVEAPGGIAGERVDVRVEFSPGGQTVLANAFSFRP